MRTPNDIEIRSGWIYDDKWRFWHKRVYSNTSQAMETAHKMIITVVAGALKHEKKQHCECVFSPGVQYSHTAKYAPK